MMKEKALSGMMATAGKGDSGVMKSVETMKQKSVQLPELPLPVSDAQQLFVHILPTSALDWLGGTYST